MSEMQQVRPKTKYKTFHYTTNVRWSGDRSGFMNSEGKPEFRVASPPEFKGEAGVWTPEDLFVAAVEICTMTTFLSLVYQRKLPLVSYESKAEGKLEFVDDGYRFTTVTLKPIIVVKSVDDIEYAEKMLHDAHAKCLIANSIRSEVEVKPEIRVA
jgi:organic hydroperoxide reductase OsmC/OhrA